LAGDRQAQILDWKKLYPKTAKPSLARTKLADYLYLYVLVETMIICQNRFQMTTGLSSLEDKP